MTVRLLHGDCLDLLATLEPESVHSVISDPPYHLTELSRGGSPRVNDPNTPFGRTRLADRGFSGHAWDGGNVAFQVGTWQALLRVLKPGGHLISFGGTRTYHRMAIAVEDAGFEIRDQLGWVFGGGMPKSHNLSGDWQGWGSGLKPAWEPILLARKPMIGTLAANMAMHQTGAINIEASRVPFDGTRPARSNERSKSGLTGTGGAVTYGSYAVRGSIAVGNTNQGRWPANLLLDGSEEVEATFAKYGDRGASAPVRGTEPSTPAPNAIYGEFGRVPGTFYGDKGSPSQFFAKCEWDEADRLFYCSKASKSERMGSKHPTVKPLKLMRYLCRLVTPRGGTVLDPFAGTGTTGLAAAEEGCDAILIEREAEYCKDIRRRLDFYLVEDGREPLIQFT